jgi:hypothetical protein
VCVCVCACLCVCVRVCARACVRACVHTQDEEVQVLLIIRESEHNVILGDKPAKS